MLTKVTAYSQWASIGPLVLNIMNRPDTDLFEVRNIDGLGAVKANVNTTPFGSIAGESFIGTSVGKRNLVLTLGLDPDWNDWTISKLRRLLDNTFMPQQSIRLVFESLEFSPVEISGWIESNEPNMFSKDPEQQISIICPDLYFKSVDPVVIQGESDQIAWPITYEGNVETGINVQVSKKSGSDPVYTYVRVHDPDPRYLRVTDLVSGHPLATNKDLFMNSIPGDKYVESRTTANVKTNLLANTLLVPNWPTINPGTETFDVYSDVGVQNWTLTYYNLFGSL